MYDTVIPPGFVNPKPFQFFPAQALPSIHPVHWLHSHFAVGGWSPLQRLSGVITAHTPELALRAGDLRSFASAYQLLADAGVRVAAVDHLISRAMYFDDPDGNGLEIYWDTRNEPGWHRLWKVINVSLSAEKIFGMLEHAEKPNQV